jgi:hypothetical protein
VGPLASIHIHRVHGANVGRALIHMGTDRIALRKTSGLRFSKLLGTGSGETFGVADADVHRWAQFCVWDSVADLETFRDSAMQQAWRRISVESWTATLAPIVWRGQWSGVDPLFGIPPIDAATLGPGVTIAAITRARIKPSQWRNFWKAVPPVAASMATTPGLLYRVGIGEAPVGLQGTFSLWASTTAINTFAYKTREHLDVVRRTHSSGWYAEEMFARFAVLESMGTLDGHEF